MHFPQDLIEAVAVRTGIDEGKVGTFQRRLRESGLVSIAGRGRGSARMNTRDGLRLVFALAATDYAAHAAAAVRVVESNRLVDGAELPGGPFAPGCEFGDALCLMVDAMRDEIAARPDWWKRWDGTAVAVVDGGRYCEVRRRRRLARFAGPAGTAFETGGDLRVTREFSFRTLEAIVESTGPIV